MIISMIFLKFFASEIPYLEATESICATWWCLSVKKV